MDWIAISQVDKMMEYDRWRKEIPYLSFPANYEVKMTPPFGGAVVRFVIKKGNAKVSIYLDCYDQLGGYGEPYWEIYPYEGDVFRCDMNDTASLLSAIETSIINQNK